MDMNMTMITHMCLHVLFFFVLFCFLSPAGLFNHGKLFTDGKNDTRALSRIYPGFTGSRVTVTRLWEKELRITKIEDFIIYHFHCKWTVAMYGVICVDMLFFCNVDHHNNRLRSSWSRPQMCLEADCPLVWNDKIVLPVLLFNAESCTQIRNGDAPVRSQLQCRSCRVIETCDQISCEETVLSSPRTMRSSCTLQWITAYIKCYHNSSGSEEWKGKKTLTVI